MRLMQEAPATVLWLLGDREDIRTNLRSEAAARGVGPQRLVLTTRVPYEEHLGRLPPACSSTRCPTMRAPPPATPCGSESQR